jgi:hypothetical protein
MGLSRSTFYDPPPVPVGPDDLVVRIGAICDEFECYGIVVSERRCASRAWW